MNKEYIYLPNNEILVIDEKGHGKKRNVDNDNMHDLLLLENNIEVINNIISKAEEEIKLDNDNKLKGVEKIIYPMLPFIFSMFMLGLMKIIIPNTQIIDIINMTSASLFFTIFVDTVAILVNKEYVKHINGTKNRLLKAYELKEDYEKKISNIKNKEIEKVNPTKTRENNELSERNDVIVLEENNQLLKESLEQLRESYLQGYKPKEKKLVLKRTKDRQY